MTDSRPIPKPIISRRLCRTIFIAGSLFSVAVYISMFIPQGVSVSRLGVSLLMVAGIAAFALLCVIPERFRGAPWTLIALGLAVAWVSTLIIFTGGPKSDFFPLFFLILILAGASARNVGTWQWWLLLSASAMYRTCYSSMLCETACAIF